MAIKLNTQSFIEKACQVHGDKYDYSKVEYVSSQTKVIIICPVHGEFEQRPHNHLHNQSCPECSKIQGSCKRTNNTQYFIEKARQVHGDTYDYSKVVYVSIRTDVIIGCKIHGFFSQLSNAHLQGQGCKQCQIENFRLNTQSFIEKARHVHGDKYDYSKSIYVRGEDTIIIICHIHGEFHQIAKKHIFGSGCPECGREEQATSQRYTTQSFIEKACQVHGDKYDYSKVEYINSQSKVIIICPVHGEFEQIPAGHLSGNGCELCGNEQRGFDKRFTSENFIEKARQVHGDRYDYSKTEYVDCKTKVIITCPVHGDFEQTPEVHLRGSGCPKCSHRVSAPEQEVIDFVKSIVDCDVETSSRPEFMYGLELDIYIPKYQLAIEFDGLYYHSELSKTKQYHLEKTILCESSNVHLIHIFEDEWIYKQDIVKSRLRNLFGINEYKMYARKCSIIDLSDHRDTVNQFLNDNHIQGSMNYQYAYGLFCGDGVEELVSVMTFNKPRTGIGYSDNEDKGTYELSRFCSKLDHNIVGGASRLLSHFIKLFDPQSIISYADRRWSYSKNNVYEKLGFHNKTIGDVGYSYIVSGTQRKHRSSFTKSKLVEKMGCSPEDTEHNFCFNHGIYRIYDCGKITYKMIRL